MGKARDLTERDRFWLDHEAALAQSGQTAKDYAAAQGLSLHAFYQARKRLRLLGHLPKAATRRRPRRGGDRTRCFEKVQIAPSTSPLSGPAMFRLSFPNGLVLEWSGAELPDPVLALVEGLSHPR